MKKVFILSFLLLGIGVAFGGVNTPPVLTTIEDQTVGEGSLLEFTVTATDPDGDPITFSATGVPTWASFDANTQIFSGTPSFSDAGNYNLIFTVTDSTNLSSLQTNTITVKEVVNPLFEFTIPLNQAVIKSTSGIAIDAAGHIYTSLESEGQVVKLTSGGREIWRIGGTIGSSPIFFNAPKNIALDNNGSFYVADSNNSRIKKYDLDGNFQLTFGSSGATNGEFDRPWGVAVDTSGNVYVADSGNNRIQKFIFDPDSNTVIHKMTFGTVGTGDGEFNNPKAVAVDYDGNIYVVDALNDRIQKFDSEGEHQMTIAGFSDPIGVTIDSVGNIYVADLRDTRGGRVQKFNPDGSLAFKFGSPLRLGSNNNDSMEMEPRAIALDVVGNIYVASLGIKKFDPEANFIVYMGTKGWDEGKFLSPKGITLDSSGNIYVSDSSLHRIQKFDSAGNFQLMFGSFGNNDGQFRDPNGIAFDSLDRIFVADTLHHQIQIVNASGVFLGKFGEFGTADGQFDSPQSVIIDSNSNIYVSDRGHRVQKFTFDFLTRTATHKLTIGTAGISGSGEGEFSFPSGLDVDSEGNIYVADAGNHRIQKFDSNGTFLTQMGSFGNRGEGFLWSPGSVSLDSSGNIYVSNSGNHIVQILYPDGSFMTQWGGVGVKSQKDGEFFNPFSMIVDGTGNIYVIDFGNLRIQKFVNANADNIAPEIEPIGDLMVEDGVLLEFTASATDFNGDAITYLEPLNMPLEATFNTDTQIFNWTPSPLDGGPHTNITFQASDGLLTGSEVITVQVLAPANVDGDNDGIIDTEDNCPLVVNAEQSDIDLDGVGDLCDDDIDGDGVLNVSDNCLDIFNPAPQPDIDGDGIGDICDTDNDNDGVFDISDNCPLVLNSDQNDFDLDGIGDSCDDDDDNDTILDVDDNCQFTHNPVQLDFDGDLYGNACDDDIDGDGIGNSFDNCSEDNNTYQTDSDGDKLGDACDPDDDNDGILDVNDNCNITPNPNQADLDGDAIGDACDIDLDNDGVNNDIDNCPLAANTSQDDSDADGDGDLCDTDDDNDSIPDINDNCSLLANFDQADLDNDGLGDLCDADIDGDGIDELFDNCPLTPNSDQSDFDFDGIGDACDTDIDGDGVLNQSDICGFTPVGVIVDSTTGCSITELCPCEGPRGTTENWKNHGKYTSCIAKSAENFVSRGLITEEEKDAIVSGAAQSICGDKK